jgi:hypothetical protein
LEARAQTLELINNELTARLDRQVDAGASIDTKAIAVAGYVVAAAAFLATQHPQPVLAGLAYGLYAVALLLGVLAYGVGSYGDVPNPRRLFNGYATRPKAQVLAALAAQRVRVFEANARRHERKARFWRSSLACLAAGVLCMLLSLVGNTGQHDHAARAGAAGSSSTASR